MAAKFHDPLLRRGAREATTPGQPKRLGRKHSGPLRPDWDAVRLDATADRLHQKSQHPNLAAAVHGPTTPGP